MASTIAAPRPQAYTPGAARKDTANPPLHEEGRGTPLPQYEKTQSVPFTLTLQEEKDNPGQFQLVVSIDPQHQKPSPGSPLKPTPSKKLIANLKEVPEVPSLGYDVSPLYHTQKSSPPATPNEDRAGWSDLDAIPPDFLRKVVPDWKVTFSRSDSAASAQSRKLADIKARIKKSGKGFVVRLLKGSNADTNEVAEVHLGQQAVGGLPALHELDAPQQAPTELDGTEVVAPSPSDAARDEPAVFEIGTSSEPGIQRRDARPVTAINPAIARWLSSTTANASRRTSVIEESFSDAETLIPDVRSVVDALEGQANCVPVTRGHPTPLRTDSVSSIVKTPTRGLSVVGPVRRVDKANRIRGKGKAVRLDLNRSGARKSVKRRSPRGSSSEVAPTDAFGDRDASSSTAWEPAAADRPFQSGSSDEQASDEYSTWQNEVHEHSAMKQKVTRRQSAEELAQSTKPKSRLRLQTNVARPKSANTSPVTRRKRSPRTHKPAGSTSSVTFSADVSSSLDPENLVQQRNPSPAWSEVDPSEELREALEKAFGSVPDDVDHVHHPTTTSIPRIEEPNQEGEAGDIPLPAELEIRSAPTNTRSPFTTFWGLALSAFSEKVFEGISLLRMRYGSEPPVPANHVRVRWTCSCGESLYDDFVERRPGAARLLEAYLNRPRAHAPVSPSSRTSTSTTMSSVFSTLSSAPTLATPASTYGPSSSWSRTSDASKYSPTTRLRSNNPFSIRMAQESWLLTCANEGRFTPKIVHIDVNEGRIKSDKDLALVLRGHYEQLNRRWLNWARLRGLTTIEFVQFEVHRNRFADIRATPSMPPTSSPSNEKSPSQHPYTFEPVDLIPPVGSAYLLHMFKHPEDYDGELITYARAPKRRERLEVGMGWGINLVEGFLAQKMWAVLMGCFGVGSGVFAIWWTIQKGDVQGAFGVAGWMVTLAGLMLGALQAWLD